MTLPHDPASVNLARAWRWNLPMRRQRFAGLIWSHRRLKERTRPGNQQATGPIPLGGRGSVRAARSGEQTGFGLAAASPSLESEVSTASEIASSAGVSTAAEVTSTEVGSAAESAIGGAGTRIESAAAR